MTSRRAQRALGSQQIHQVSYYPLYSHTKPKFDAPQMRIHRALRLLSLLLFATQHSGAAAAADGPAAARSVGRQGLASFLRRSTDAVSARRLAPGDFDKVRTATTRPISCTCIHNFTQYSSNNYIVLTTTACHTLPFTTPHPQLNSIFATSTFLFPDIDENIKAYTTGCVPAFWYVPSVVSPSNCSMHAQESASTTTY